MMATSCEGRNPELAHEENRHDVNAPVQVDEGIFLSRNPSPRLRSLEEFFGHLAEHNYEVERAMHSIDLETSVLVMDMIQLYLDDETSHKDDRLRKICFQCLLTLSELHGLLPTSIYLSGVTKEGTYPVSGGGYADIWKGLLEDTRIVCLKVLRVFIATYDEKRLMKQVSNEVLIWRQLRHRNILQFLGVTRELFQPSYCIVSPWMEKGNVTSYSRRYMQTRVMSKMKMMYQISEGLKYLHEHNPPIVHSDIKGLNILVSDEEECCIADFGLATIANESPDGQLHVSTSEAVLRGSLPWLAPELMNPDCIGVPSRTARDMYALGCTMYELFTGNPPFSDARLNECQIMLKVLSGARPMRPPLCPNWLWDLMQSCWKEDFGERPSASEVLCRFRFDDLVPRTVLHGLPMRRTPNRRLPDIPGGYSYDPNRLWEGASLQIAWKMFRARVGPKLHTQDYSADLLSD